MTSSRESKGWVALVWWLGEVDTKIIKDVGSVIGYSEQSKLNIKAFPEPLEQVQPVRVLLQVVHVRWVFPSLSEC